MRVAIAVLIGLSGCGRLGFDELATPDTGPIGHDEDGDGVGDADDVCPHLAGSQLDSDGDLVGDDCDPEPGQPRQQILRFATMQPGDQPFSLQGTAGWTQQADAAHLDGVGSGQIVIPFVLGEMRIALGVDILSLQGGAVQHQISIIPFGDIAQYHFAELNEGPGFDNAGVTFFDGNTFVAGDTSPLTNGFHTGAATLQITAVPDGEVAMDGGWEGETYGGRVPSSVYQGTDNTVINILNTELAVRWLIVIVAP